MGLGNLTDRSAGETILASFYNTIHDAMEGDFIGRNNSGAPTASQNLGTAAFPWGTLRADGLVIGGSAIDLSQITAPPFRVVSGAKRSTSNQPAYIDPAGSGNGASFTVLGATTNLQFDVNGVAKTLAADLVKSSLSAAPAANNTALVNDTVAADQESTRTWGEHGGLKDITIDTIGSELTSLNGTLQAFKINDGANDEYFMGFLDTTNTKITKCFRGFFYDDSLLPINRIKFADGDTITLMKMHYIFQDQDLTTVDTTTVPPVYDTVAPSAPATGDYWYDMGNALWKRYDGATFQNVNRTFVGWAVMDDTDCVAARSVDFDARYSSENDISAEIQTTEIVRGIDFFGKINVAGEELVYVTKLPSWNITTDLAASADMYNATEQVSTDYYLYIKDDGAEVISDISPYFIPEKFGMYHPHNPWRLVATVENDGSSDIVSLSNELIKLKKATIKDVKSDTTDGGTFTLGSFETRDLNTLDDPDNIGIDLTSNQFTLPKGEYFIRAWAPAFQINFHKARLQNITDSTTDLLGTSETTSTAISASISSMVVGRISLSEAKVFELQHRSSVTLATIGKGRANSFGVDEIYSQIEIRKLD